MAIVVKNFILLGLKRRKKPLAVKDEVKSKGVINRYKPCRGAVQEPKVTKYCQYKEAQAAK